jgi:hypothetical protein
MIAPKATARGASRVSGRRIREGYRSEKAKGGGRGPVSLELGEVVGGDEGLFRAEDAS